ncbi:MAG: adenylate cyclase, partial [Bacteroidaceae bacterium]|nr:adenylate cyclase [Bacteroidaceae bacterium]
GWLAQLGFLDFAGDSAVHSVGGWAALSGAIILGPRIGKYDKDGNPRAIPGHSMSLAVIGLFVLWLGWFGFNPGSTMSFQNPSDVMHILMTTNTAAITAVLTSTITAWIYLGKPDLSMTVNGCLAGLVAITGSCAYVTIGVSLLIGAIAGVFVVFAVMFFDRIGIDDPVGATSVHLGCGIFGTICVGLFSKENVTSLSSKNGLFYGGGFKLLGIQLLGIISIGAFVFASSILVWVALKKTIGIRVSRNEEISGLDIEEHGNTAYPDFTCSVNNMDYGLERSAGAAAVSVPVPVAEAIPITRVIHTNTGTPKFTKIEIICKESRFELLKNAMTDLGITGMTVSHVLGCGQQKGRPEYYRGALLEATLLPKLQVDIVVSKIPVRSVIEEAKKALYTGHIGDGKIFVYDVE